MINHFNQIIGDNEKKKKYQKNKKKKLFKNFKLKIKF
jgi:hypothetical protein